MRAKKLNPKKILKTVKAYLKERGQALINLCSKPKSRGRPKEYPDEIILTNNAISPESLETFIQRN